MPLPAPAEPNRKPIIWAVSISKLRQLFEEIVPQYSAAADIRILDKGFDDALQAVREGMRGQDIDVLVAAGSNGAFLRRHVNLPVALVKVSGFDVMGALARARRISDRVAIVLHQAVAADLEQLKQGFGLDIEQRAYVTADDARDRVHELAALGIRAIVGPGLVTDLAEQAGLSGVFLYSMDAVQEALEDALEIARFSRIEAARRERLNTILRQLKDGVVAVDMEERIQTLNPAMEQLLAISGADAIGRRLSDVAPELNLRRTLDKGVTSLEEIQTLGHKTIVTNRIPIQEHGVQTGAVLTFQDAASIQRVDRSLRSSKKPRQLAARYELDHILGESPALLHCKALAARYAKTDATVLISGESGTGKELLAQGIHSASRRRRLPFLALNCAAFPESLLESELFGYEEGAFTGTRRGGKAGLFEAAHTGTIFLDEIGEMPIALQTRLLRVLQEKEVIRLGATEPTPIDVRVIVATHRNLAERVASGQFRQDLYYRLNILRIDVPPLRERPKDVPLLTAALLDKALRRLGIQRDPRELLRTLMPRLIGYAWPGNVRELENLVERVAVFCSDTPEDQPIDARQLYALLPELSAGAPAPPTTLPLSAVHASSEVEYIRKTLGECNGDRDEACRRLGIGRTTLWRKLKRAHAAHS